MRPRGRDVPKFNIHAFFGRRHRITKVNGKYPDPRKVGVIKRMRERCVPGSFSSPPPKSLGTRLVRTYETSACCVSERAIGMY